MKSRNCLFVILGGLTTAIVILVCALLGLTGVWVAQSGGCFPNPLASLPADVLFRDDFSSEQASKCNGWVFARGDNADILWSVNKQTIIVKRAEYTHLSFLRGKSFADFGVEVEAEPASDARTVSAAYGIAFRIGDEQAKNLYEFGVTTSNQYYLAKRIDGKLIQPPLIDFTPSSHVQPRPGKNRLGVLVEGSTIALYINGNLVNTLKDDSIKSGSVGVFASADESGSAQVDFTRVTVWSVAKAKAEWGVRLVGEPTPASGIWFDDDFSSQQASRDKGWAFKTGADTDAVWSPGKFVLVLKKKNSIYASVLPRDYQDAGIEIEAQAESADPRTEYGIVFRSNAQEGNAARYYRFGIASFDKGKTYSYYLLKMIDGKTPEPWLVEVRPSPSIKPGGKNRLGVLAEGTTISLYINGQRVKTVADDSLSSGRVGVFVHNVDADRAQVAFSRVTVYTVAKAKAEWGAPPARVPGVVYHEEFKSQRDAEENGWEFGSTATHDSIWSPNKLSFVVRKGKTEFNGPLYYDDFKDCGIEIEAQPENKPLSYGIAFGVKTKSGRLNAYTFGVTTGGNFYLYRMVDGAMVEPDPVFLRPSPHIKQGAAQNRLGVLVEGSTVALYINGQPVRTIADASAVGGAGVFVTNIQNDQARVDFSRLTIYTLDRAKREWSAPRAATPGVWMNDDFSSKSESEANGWVFSTGSAVDNVWSLNKFTITVKQSNASYSTYPAGIFEDMGFEIEAQPEGGANLVYGIIFRSNRSIEHSEYYRFGITPQGAYTLRKGIDGKAVIPPPIDLTSSPYIKPGNSKNRLGVLTEGSKISLYINGNLVKTLNDDSIKRGSAGLWIWNRGSDQAKVVFSRYTVYTVEKAKTELGKR